MLIHQKFSNTARLVPNAWAISMGHSQMTYEELEISSNKVANGLIAKGVMPGSVVGICMRRSPELIVSLIGILKAGAAYLPLDPAYPKDRLDIMISLSQVQQILASEELAPLLPPSTGIFTFESLEVKSLPDYDPQVSVAECDLVYVIYTSGSTGTPKGVSLGHGALGNLIDWQNTQTVNKETVTLQFTPISFDVHFQEIFSTLIMGGRLVLIDEEDRLDPSQLIQVLDRQKVNRLFLPYVALGQMSEYSVSTSSFPYSVSEIITAGEQLKVTPAIRMFFKELKGAILYNHYGPSESHVITSYTMTGDPDQWPALPPIGQAIDNCEVLILNRELFQVNEGQEGELYLRGKCLALGYFNSPELTAERFLQHPILGRIYKTGDIGRVNETGDIIYVCRIDGQVKIRGHRVEKGEIEIKLLEHPEVDEAAVALKTGALGDLLCAYFIGKTSPMALREFLKKCLPDYMVPSHFIKLSAMPLTPSGKVDHKKLPLPSKERPDLSVPFSAPETLLQEQLCLSWMKFLDLSSVGIDDVFFDLGGNSLLALKFMVDFNQYQEKKISVVNIFNHPTIRGLSSYLEGDTTTKKRSLVKQQFSLEVDEHDIAVIAMAGRFPGAENLDQFWQNLMEGKSSLERFPVEEIHPSVSPEVFEDENFVPVRGDMPGHKEFDFRFFGMTPREAELMDPQQRKFLEIAYEALEVSGHDPDRYDGPIGVFAGTGNGLYGRLVELHPEKIKNAGEFNVMLGLEKDYIATRTAFKLNLKGPALSLYTGCSTSLVAIIEAAKSLRCKDCDMALAGGISISGAPNRGHLFHEGGILSKDGQCRPFDEKATGTVFSDGAGVVVLKRLKDAREDGDSILAVIKGLGINNDGSGKMSFTAPSVEGQLDVINRAQVDSGIDPRTISYVEAHGTATPVGDPIEVEALTRSFGQFTSDKNYCYLSSVKSNIGHLTAAAGVVGFIKVVLSLKKRLIPGTANYTSPNKLLDLANSPFIITSDTRHYPITAHPRRAALSSFGVGGTNGHVIVEEYQEEASVKLRNAPRELLFKLSAKSEGQLNEMQSGLISQLNNVDVLDWPMIAHTLEMGRKEFQCRAFITAQDKQDLMDLRTSNSGKGVVDRKRDLYFMFPGQGSQYPEMGKDLYYSSPIFAAYFDQCSELLSRHVPYDLKNILFDVSNKELLNNTYYTQPAIFVIEYSLTKTLMDLGLEPKGLLGHSIGEYAAATLAGVFTLEDGLKIIAKRAEAISELPPGTMLSVSANHLKVKELIGDLPLDVAVINGPEACVVAGPEDVVEKLKQRLVELDVATIVLKTSHAFHSRTMLPAVQELKKFLDTVPMQRPIIPICSSVTGQWEVDLMCTPDYWAKHIVNCVSFSDAASRFAEKDNGLFLEVGPRTVLSNIMRKICSKIKGSNHKVVALLSDKAPLETKSFMNALGVLWTNGIRVQRPEILYLPHERKKVPTITYAFEKTMVWLDHPKQKIKETQAVNSTKVIKMENDKKNALIDKLMDLFEGASGIDMKGKGIGTTFLELGMDSLFLTQMALKIKKEFKINITFRQLLEEFTNIELLSDALMDKWSYEAPVVAVATKTVVEESIPVKIAKEVKAEIEVPRTSITTQFSSGSIEELLARQLDLMGQQIKLLGQGRTLIETPSPVQTATPTIKPKVECASSTRPNVTRGVDIKKSKEAFGAAARIVVEKSNNSLVRNVQVQEFFQRYIEKTKGSKKFAQDNRKNHADPRVVTGFRPESKEIIYPVVVNRSKGQKLWDIDGNEYVDMTCGFGSNFFGNGNERIKAALEKQLNDGIEVGPQQPLVADVSKLVNELTDNERTAFCNTGSEAVLGAMRLARTVTGREKIIVFSGSYHGINDEVIIRGNIKRPFPAAPGINEASVSNMVVLDYGTEESLKTIREMAGDVAAVLVEPVQSRRCDFHPVDFLKEVRKITQEAQTCLIFDEVITGFRIHPGGAQAHFGIRADLCTYGKIVGGGMPIGLISGRAEYMDALDGGHWEFGDDSTPTVGVTYFAGTFVRHPLALAAAKAALEILKEGGVKRLNELNDSAQRFTDDINHFCLSMNIPLKMNNFGSLMKPKWNIDVPGGENLFALLRYHGVHTYDGFPWFVNLAHTSQELEKVLAAFKRSLADMQTMGLLPEMKALNASKVFDQGAAPVPGAKLGRDQNGNPAWFVERSGEYFIVEN